MAAEAFQLEAVAEAILQDDLGVARELLERVDCEALWSHYDAAGSEWAQRHRKETHTAASPVPRKRITNAVKLEVAIRDGWRCRYCGLRLISFDFSRRLNELFPDTWVIDQKVERRMHPTAYLLRYTQDHVVTRSASGSDHADNLVACCGTRQFQKGSCSLDELQLANPFLRPPGGGRLGRASWAIRADPFLISQGRIGRPVGDAVMAPPSALCYTTAGAASHVALTGRTREGEPNNVARC